MKNSYENTRYNWQHPQWPHFEYDLTGIQDLIYHYLMEASSLSGGLTQLPEDLQSDTIIDIMVREALKSSEIEGERIDHDDIRSSIRKELGILHDHTIKDAKAVGIAKLMVSLRQTFHEPLSTEQLYNCHSMLLSDPSQRRGMDIGMWRRDLEPMQIVSGAIGQEKVHFEAPSSDIVPQETDRFIQWFNASANAKMPGVVRAAIAHLYFESVHPFDDGNGRIGRAISEKALSQELGKPVLLSLSSTIQSNKKEYYAQLSRASQYSIEVTPWITYFVNTVYQAQLDAKNKIQFVLQKTKFWKRYEHLLNERQEKVIARMFKAGESGFMSGINANKYMTSASCSKATATRDLADLLQKGCIAKLAQGGRSTRYEIVM